MHLAASPIQFPQYDTSGRAAALWSFPCHLQTASDRDHLIPPSAAVSQIMQTGNFGNNFGAYFLSTVIVEGYVLVYPRIASAVLGTMYLLNREVDPLCGVGISLFIVGNP